MDSLESFDPTVVSNGGLCDVFVGKVWYDNAVILGPVFVILIGSTSVSDSGNNVLRSV